MRTDTQRHKVQGGAVYDVAGSRNRRLRSVVSGSFFTSIGLCPAVARDLAQCVGKILKRAGSYGLCPPVARDLAPCVGKILKRAGPVYCNCARATLIGYKCSTMEMLHRWLCVHGTVCLLECKQLDIHDCCSVTRWKCMLLPKANVVTLSYEACAMRLVDFMAQERFWMCTAFSLH
jgi:hypothetical protein